MATASSEAKQQATAWLKSATVGFLGCGNLAQAMIRGFVQSELVPAENFIVSATSESSQNFKICQDIGAHCTTSNAEVAKAASIVFIAVKPHLVRPVLAECEFSDDALLISVATRVKLVALTEASRTRRVIRALPNTATRLCQGVAIYTYNKGQLTVVEQASVELLMDSLGSGRYVPESLLQPMSAVSACGMAYMYMGIEAMADGGVKAGVPRALAYELAAQTMKGAAAMVLETGQHPGALKDAVCSPGGSTIAGVHALEKSGYRASLMDAIEATMIRGKQLG